MRDWKLKSDLAHVSSNHVFIWTGYKDDSSAGRVNAIVLSHSQSDAVIEMKRQGLTETGVIVGSDHTGEPLITLSFGEDGRLLYDAASYKANALVLVHPGSLVGSARDLLGRKLADDLRQQVFERIDSHVGPFIAIDGSFSDELSAHENASIIAACERAQGAGYVGIRAWGSDDGELPYTGWEAIGPPSAQLIHDCQQDAAAALSVLLKGVHVEVTGAWASQDPDSGCANCVVQVISSQLGSTALVSLDATAVFDDVEVYMTEESEDDGMGFRL
jgi:hypothetical protein